MGKQKYSRRRYLLQFAGYLVRRGLYHQALVLVYLAISVLIPIALVAVLTSIFSFSFVCCLWNRGSFLVFSLSLATFFGCLPLLNLTFLLEEVIQQQPTGHFLNPVKPKREALLSDAETLLRSSRQMLSVESDRLLRPLQSISDVEPSVLLRPAEDERLSARE